MSIRHVTLVAGTRPEVIKLAPVLRVLRTRPAFRARMLVTGQHREMLRQACDACGIAPDVDLAVMEDSQSATTLMARVLEGVRAVLERDRPDLVLVHGDTTTCLAAALAAFHASVPVGHVEAGLRTHDLAAPWPEEMNRRLTDPLCRWCFAPTERAARNLRAERIPDDRIFLTGNTAVDAVQHALDTIGRTPPARPAAATIPPGGRLVVVTGHRRESFGEPLRRICSALREVVDQRPDVTVIYPVHLNPNVQDPVHELLGGHPRIRLAPPLGYLEFVALMARADVMVTDSGGIQEEAPSLGTPVVITRAATERPEAVEAGVAVLVGTAHEAIVAAIRRLLDAPVKARQRLTANPFGDGHAADRIVDVLERTAGGPPDNRSLG